MTLHKLDQFHQTRLGHTTFGLVELAMAYGFVDWALDTGSFLWWIAAGFLLLGMAENFVKAVWVRKK
ncbi:MAG TPA: hypothetical protein VLE99_05205 [Candidatus Saccharimonadales bacterium]|nr:hypothetical protein [Candidatus Saccharimonadales bacterium]